jgi:membrane-bound ClpP family serine protease
MSAVPPVDRASRFTLIADRVGMVGSLLCALHCALIPIAVALLPALGVVSFGGDVDQMVVVFATVLGITSLTIGFRRHRAYNAWILMVPGVLLLWLASFTPLHDHSGAHVALMVAGGLMVAAAHLANLRLTHRSNARVAARAAGPAYY